MAYDNDIPVAPYEGDLIDRLTYSSYVANRQMSPEISPERWATVYAAGAAMEERYQQELAEVERKGGGRWRRNHGQT